MYILKEAIMQLAQWGNSLAVRLPVGVVNALALKSGDEIEITIAGVREMQIARKSTPIEALKALRQFRGSLPAGFKFDRELANQR
jgi:antitoxin MazE